ncbi:MAG: cob(I)yrinic acid a,c-diamide adenosyltransferase [Parachlamydiales bacterium]|jgi:cob(I)alamin adenosyltransferase
MTKIYTKTGDAGETSLFTGKRVSKADAFIAALGAIDECNSAIGLSIAAFPKDISFDSLREELIIIQHALFDVGAAVATPRTQAVESKLQKTRFDTEATNFLESWIDKHEHELPKLKAFILPGGHPAGATLHLARTICRRAERHAVPLYQNADITEEVLIYLNRLSDYLFVAARQINHLAGSPETLWEHHKIHSN